MKGFWRISFDQFVLENRLCRRQKHAIVCCCKAVFLFNIVGPTILHSNSNVVPSCFVIRGTFLFALSVSVWGCFLISLSSSASEMAMKSVFKVICEHSCSNHMASLGLQEECRRGSACYAIVVWTSNFPAAGELDPRATGTIYVSKEDCCQNPSIMNKRYWAEPVVHSSPK